MHVYVKLIGVPARGPASEAVEPVAQETRSPMTVELPEGATVSQLASRMRQLGASIEDIQMTLLNGKKVGFDAVLSDKDAVAFVGQITGE